MRLLLLFALLASSTACRFGEISFDSSLQGRTFDPAGTVFSYLDQHDDNFVSEDNPRVVVASTWIIFDPNGDLNDLEGSALADYSHELKLRDALSLVFDEQGAVAVGANFKSVVRAGEERGDGALLSHVHLEPERLDGSSTYQDTIPLASQRTVDVTITTATFTAASPIVAGNVVISYTRTDDDPGTVREGTFAGTFTAPLVVERTAEQNLALLEIEDVLGLPLSPRAAPVAP